MFLNRLSPLQRRSFLALVTKMALADGKVAPQEVSVLEDFSRLLGQTEPIPAEEIYGATNIEPFDTEDSRIITVLGMLMVAYSDQNFHVDESAVIAETVKAFAIPTDRFESLKGWVQSYGDLMDAADKLIG